MTLLRAYPRLLSALAACLLPLLAVNSVLAQDSSPAQPSSAQQPDQSGVEQSDATIRSNVNLVSVFFNVKDKHGALMPNQTKDDFQLLEDNKPQTIKYFTADSNLPLTLGILIDTSGSQARVLDMEKEVGGAFLRQILTDKDLAYVMDFDVQAELLQDYTRDVHRLQNALNKVKINSGISSGGSGVPGLGQGPVPVKNAPGTVLYDAVYLSANDMLSKEVGRKAMILLTDGEDEGSKLKIKDAMEAAQRADAIIYVLLCADRGQYFGLGMGYSGESEMRKLTEATGGRVVNVGNKFDKLREAFDEISNELRSQYNIGYVSTNPVQDGAYRKLEIKNKQGYKIQTRAGYYARKSEPHD
jgi:VWFA-related protein